jgi:hypothetical protein
MSANLNTSKVIALLLAFAVLAEGVTDWGGWATALLQSLIVLEKSFW